MNEIETAPRQFSISQPSRSRMSIGPVAVGALALGAVAVGALAIGRLAVGTVALKRGRVRSLVIDDLDVRRLHVHELVIDSGRSTFPLLGNAAKCQGTQLRGNREFRSRRRQLRRHMRMSQQQLHRSIGRIHKLPCVASTE